MANGKVPPARPTTQNPRQIGTIPANSQLQPDLTGQSYVSGQYPTTRVMPVVPSGVAGNVSNTVSVVQVATDSTLNALKTVVSTPSATPASGGTTGTPTSAFSGLASGVNTIATMMVAGSSFLSYSNYFVVGTTTSTTTAAGFLNGETAIQTTTGAAAPVISVVNGQLLLGPITGSPDAVNTWVGQTSATVFTPSAIPAATGGLINANEIGTILVDGNVPQHAGQLLISQPGNSSAVWADPQVQGLYPVGSSTTSPPAYTVPTKICPVLVGAADPTGLLQNLNEDASGNLLVSLVGSLATVNTNVTKWDSTAVGAPTTFGSPPIGNVIGTNSEIFVGANPVSTSAPVPVSATTAANTSGNPIFVSAAISSTNISTNVNQWDGTSLGAPSALGSPQGTGNIISVNAELCVGANAAATAHPVPVSATVAQNTAANPIFVTLTDSTNALSAAISAWGTAPTGTEVMGVNAELFIANTKLAAVSNYGTGPSAVAALGVNAYVTNTVTVAFSSSSKIIVWDGTNQNTYKPASTVAVVGDTSLVTQISPNQPTAMMVGNVPGSAPGNTVVIGGIYNSTPPSFSTGQTGPLQLTSAGALITSGTSTVSQGTAAAGTAGWPVVGGNTAESTAAWTSGTAGNTTLAQTVTGYGTVIVTVNQGSTITGGVLTFEASDTLAGTNWYAIQGSPVTGGNGSSIYTLAASTNAAFQFSVAAFVQIRVRLSTTISGSATVNVGIAAMAFGGGGSGGGSTGAQFAMGSSQSSSAVGTIALGYDGTNVRGLLASSTGQLHVVVDTVPTTLVNQGTSPWVVSNSGTFAVQASIAASQTIAVTNVGTFAVQASIAASQTIAVTNVGTFAVQAAGTKTNNNAAPGATNVGVLPGIANAAVQTWTEGDQVLESMDLSGNQRMAVTNYAGSAAVTNGIAGLIPTGNYGTSNTSAASWTSATSLNTTQVLVNNINGYSSISVTLGQAPTGTLTGGVVTFETSNDNSNWYPISGVDPDTLAIIGPTYTFVAATYNIFMFTIPAPYFRVRLSTAIIGSGTVTVGYALDSLPTVHSLAGTISGALGSTYNSANPAPSAGANVNLQSDYVGTLYTRPFRRAQTVSKATTISASTGTTTVLAAQGSGIFADLSMLVITVTAAATTDTAFTATLSDGTVSYIYDLDSGAVATAVAAPPPLILAFNPPLPATSANTIWTVALSSSTPTVHITTVAVLEAS